MTIQRMLTKTVVCGLTAILASALGCGFLYAAGKNAESAAIIAAERPAVEVVFVLDTTGSMGGLIAAAKDKIWSFRTQGPCRPKSGPTAGAAGQDRRTGPTTSGVYRSQSPGSG